MLYLVLYYDDNYNIDFEATKIFFDKQIALEQNFEAFLSSEELEQLRQEGRLNERWAIDENGWRTEDGLGCYRLIELNYEDSNKIMSTIMKYINE